MEPVRVRVPPTFRMPDLSDLEGIDAAVPAPSTTGTTVVVDTDDLALSRWGVRLTHDGAAWKLVVPEHPGGPMVAPTHHTLQSSAGEVPGRALLALARLVDPTDLGRVARVEVRREGIGLVRDGAVQVHVSDEEISVHTDRGLTARFREVVVRQGPHGAADLAGAVESALTAAGAQERDVVPRTVRILGPAATAAPDLPAVDDGDEGADAAWRRALVAGLADLLVTDVHLRMDDAGRSAPAGVDVIDGLVGLVELLDADPVVTTGLATLRALVDHVDRHAQRLSVLGDDLPRLEERARTALARAVRNLHDHQDGDGHAAMVAGLWDLAGDRVLTAAEAGGDAEASVAERVAKRWAPLAGALTPDDPSNAAALGALGAAAAVAPGKAPRRFAHAATAAAAAARDHGRALRVQHWLAEQAPDLPAAEAFRAGHLAGRRDGDAMAARTAWREAFASLTATRATKWLP